MAEILWCLALAAASLWNPLQWFNVYSPDPMVRMEQLLADAENLQHVHEEWRRFWVNDQPSQVTPYRIHGGVGPAPILPPIKEGEKPMCDPPDRAEILRAMPRIDCGNPHVYESWHDDLEFTVEKMTDKLGPPRFFPLIGMAQLHHSHWKCTVYFTETIESAYPLPFKTTRRRCEVVYLDKDQLHLCGKLTPDDLPIRVGSFNVPPPEFLVPQPLGGVCGMPSAPQHRVVACWENRVHLCENTCKPGTHVRGLKGSVYLVAPKTGKPVAAEGTLHVEMRDSQARPVASWTLDAEALAKLERKDLIGVGYTLFLPLARTPPADVTLTVTYRTESGRTCSDTPTALQLSDAPGTIARVQHTEPRAFPATKSEHKPMTLDQVVELCKRGVADDIVIRQMELTESAFHLTVDDILYLHDHGVPNAVIRAMQDQRRPRQEERIFMGEIQPIPGR